MTILDRFQITKVTNEEKKQVIDNPNWNNYILTVKRSMKTTAEEYTDEQIPMNIPIDFLQRKLIGGSTQEQKGWSETEIRVSHWNIQSINTQRRRKIELMKSTKSIAISVQ